MGWTCQHDANGYCKLLKITCVPGIKGCILKKSKYLFTTGSYEEDKKIQDSKESKEEIDFVALARSN